MRSRSRGCRPCTRVSGGSGPAGRLSWGGRLAGRDPALAEFLPGGGWAGEIAFGVAGPQAVEDDGQVAVAEFGGAFGAGELDRGHELEDQGQVMGDDARTKQVLD